MKTFYQKHTNISKPKSCFYFLRNHFMYDTMNSWNGLQSIANEVKIYNLGLEGNCWEALRFLEESNYLAINIAIEEWEEAHPGYEVNFNGRNGGYLVLCNKHNNRNVLPDILDHVRYDCFKDEVREQYGSMKEFMPELQKYVRLVQDFDKLCDELTAYVNELSKKDFVKEAISRIVDEFNFEYKEDLEKLNLPEVAFIDNEIDVSRLSKALTYCLTSALNMLDDYDVKYKIADGKIIFTKD